MLDDYLQTKNWRYHLVLSSFIANQRIPQSDWMWDTTATANQQMMVSIATFPWWLTRCKKNLSYQLILSKDIVNQRTLQWNWLRGTTGHTKPKVVVSDATFLWWLFPSKKVYIDSFQRYWWSKNPAIWLEGRYNGSHPTKSSTLICYLSFIAVTKEKA